MPSGLRSSMLPRTGKGFPEAAQLIRGLVPKLNSSSEATSRIWGIRSGERKDTHPGVITRAGTWPPKCLHLVMHGSGGTAICPVAEAKKPAESCASPLRPSCPTSDQLQSLPPAPSPPEILSYPNQGPHRPQPHGQNTGSGLIHFWALPEIIWGLPFHSTQQPGSVLKHRSDHLVPLQQFLPTPLVLSAHQLACHSKSLRCGLF